jgi:YD repeat-containing protein
MMSGESARPTVGNSVGCAVEFGYDAAFRLASLKDPYGFVNQVNYDGEGKLDALTHSALGTATFEYDGPDRRMSRLTLGNGAATEYAYDAQRRQTGFDIKDGLATRLLRHDWGYDALNRKTSLVVDIPSAPALTSLNIEYDAASRLARETLYGSWDVRYQYDQGENRTLLDVNGDITTFAHGAGNRETGAFPTALLQYDFKGNVTVRPPLDGSDAFSYQ